MIFWLKCFVCYTQTQCIHYLHAKLLWNYLQALYKYTWTELNSCLHLMSFALAIPHYHVHISPFALASIIFTLLFGCVSLALRLHNSNTPMTLTTLTMSTARLLWCAQWMVVVLCVEPVIWQPSARQPPCPFSRSKSQYAAVGSTPNEKCRRATVTGCTGLPGLHPSTQESNTLRQVIPHMESP